MSFLLGLYEFAKNIILYHCHSQLCSILYEEHSAEIFLRVHFGHKKTVANVFAPSNSRLTFTNRKFAIIRSLLPNIFEHFL